MIDKPFDPYDPKHWLSTPEPVDHCTNFKCGNATLIKSHLGVWTCPVCLSSYGNDEPPCDRYMLVQAVQHGLYSVWIKDGKIIMLVNPAIPLESIVIWQYDPKAQKWSKVT